MPKSRDRRQHYSKAKKSTSPCTPSLNCSFLSDSNPLAASPLSMFNASKIVWTKRLLRFKQHCPSSHRCSSSYQSPPIAFPSPLYRSITRLLFLFLLRLSGRCRLICLQPQLRALNRHSPTLQPLPSRAVHAFALVIVPTPPSPHSFPFLNLPSVHPSLPSLRFPQALANCFTCARPCSSFPDHRPQPRPLSSPSSKRYHSHCRTSALNHQSPDLFRHRLLLFLSILTQETTFRLLSIRLRRPIRLAAGVLLGAWRR